MKRIITLCVVILTVWSTTLKAKTAKPDTISARRAFVEMPLEVIDLLQVNTRLDMLDYFDADSIWKATNSLNGQSNIECLTPDFMEVILTPLSGMEIKILKKKNGDNLVLAAYTTGEAGDGADSELRLFNASMEEMPLAKVFKEPELKDFFEFPKGSVTKFKEIEDIMPFYTVVYVLDEKTSNLVAKLTLGDFITLEDRKLVELFLKPELTYVWNGSKFSRKQ